MRPVTHRIVRRVLLSTFVLLACTCVVAGVSPGAIHGRTAAVDIDGGPGTPRTSQLAPDDSPARAAINGASRGEQLVLSPPRLTVAAKPGDLLRIPVTLQNRGDKATSVTLAPGALEAGGDATTFARLGTGASATERSWVEVPYTRLALAAREQVTFPVYVRVPRSGQPGLHPLALVVTRTVEQPAPTSDNSTRVSLRLSLASQLLVSLPGPVKIDGRLAHAHGPRLVWHGQHARFSAIVENHGGALLDARPEWRSGSFAAIASSTKQLPRTQVLPAGTRQLEVTWNDAPWFGVYHPVMMLADCRTGCISGTHATRLRYPAVVVLPPWWVLVLIAVALLVPTVAEVRRRRAYRAALDARRPRHDDD